MNGIPDVVFALLADVRVNSRALRQIRALASAGLHTHILSLGPEGSAAEMGANITLEVVEQPAGTGPAFFYRAHRLFKQRALYIRAHIYHASDLYTLPAMARATRLHGGQLTFDSRELYPYVGYTAGKPWVSLFWHALEGHYIRGANAVFTVNDSIADRLVHSYGIARPIVLPNVPPLQTVARSDIIRDRTGIPADTKIVLYQGHIKKGRGCKVLLDLAEHLTGACVVFLGDGDLRPQLEDAVRSRNLIEKVKFLDPVLPDDLLRVTASADIGACLIEDLSLSLHYALPNKLFEYLMAGLPVIVSNLPEMSRVVSGFEVGCVVDMGDEKAVISTLNSMITDQESQARWKSNIPAVFETFRWEKASEVFINTFQGLLNE